MTVGCLSNDHGAHVADFYVAFFVHGYAAMRALIATAPVAVPGRRRATLQSSNYSWFRVRCPDPGPSSYTIQI